MLYEVITPSLSMRCATSAERFSSSIATPAAGLIQRPAFLPDGDLFDAIRNGKAEIVTGQIDHCGKSEVVLTDGRRA